MHAPVLVTPAAATPVSLTEAKAHLRVDHTSEDTLITSLVEAATAHLDGYSGILGRALVTQTWRQDFDGFWHCLRLPIPAATVSALKWTDDADTPAETTIAASNYELQNDALGSFVRLIDDFVYPSNLAETRAVRVTFTAGYGAASAVPGSIKAAILLLVGHWYANREAVGESMSELPMAVDALLAPYRRVGI